MTKRSRTASVRCCRTARSTRTTASASRRTPAASPAPSLPHRRRARRSRSSRTSARSIRPPCHRPVQGPLPSRPRPKAGSILSTTTTRSFRRLRSGWRSPGSRPPSGSVCKRSIDNEFPLRHPVQGFFFRKKASPSEGASGHSAAAPASWLRDQITTAGCAPAAEAIS